MNSEMARRWGPWVLILAVLVPVGVVVAPILLTTVQTLAQAAVIAGVLGVVVYCLPLLALIIRNLVWKARKEVIAAMPIETLELGLQKIDERISNITARLASGRAAYARMEQQVEGARKILKPERYEFQKRKLVRYAELLERQDKVRQAAKVTRAEVGQQVEAAKVELSLGQGFAEGAKVLSAGMPGGGTDDMNVAFESVNNVLVEAQAALEMALADADEMQQVEIHEVEKPTAALPSATGEDVKLPAPKEGVFVRRNKPN